MGHAHVRLAPLTFGHVDVGWVGGWVGQHEPACKEAWKHLSSASWASLLGYWRWAPVFLAVWERTMAFWMRLSKWLPSSRRRVVRWIVRTSGFWVP